MNLSGIERGLWLASTTGNLVLLALLLLRRRGSSLFFFTALIALNLVRTAILFTLLQLKLFAAYFYTYWTLGAVDVVAQIGIVYELAAVFRPTGFWARDTQWHLLLLSGVGLLVAAVLTTFASGSEADWIDAMIVKGSFFVATLMAEFFTGMIVLSVSSGLPWRGVTSKIAIGFGIYSLVDVLIEAGHNVLGKGYMSSVDVHLAECRSLTYVCCVVYWAVTLWASVPAAGRDAEAATEATVLWSSVLSPAVSKER